MRAILTKLAHSFLATGILVATLAFAVSLTPSLIPRSYLVQGVLSGLSAALGYGIGFVAYSLWTYLELPQLRDRTLKATRIAVAGTCVVIAAVFLWRTLEWQNSIRVLMDLAPLDTASPLKTAIVAVVVFATLMLLAHLFRHTFQVFSGWLGRFVPRRVSHLVGGLLAVALFWSVAEGLIFRLTLRILDSSFQEMDALIEDDLSRPRAIDQDGKRGFFAVMGRTRQAGPQVCQFRSNSGRDSHFLRARGCGPYSGVCRNEFGRHCG